tara:strand:+ start:82 stop:219 length:138 start_codon:yes stop_codon:yes gene_type:complete
LKDIGFEKECLIDNNEVWIAGHIAKGDATFCERESPRKTGNDGLR